MREKRGEREEGCERKDVFNGGGVRERRGERAEG